MPVRKESKANPVDSWRSAATTAVLPISDLDVTKAMLRQDL
jgi:hypothetical protein